MLEMAIAVVDKTSLAAKDFQSIGSKVRRIPGGVETAAVPVPAPIEAKQASYGRSSARDGANITWRCPKSQDPA